MKKLLTLLVFMVTYTCQYGYAYDTYNTVELFRSYGKQQVRVKNSKGNWTVKTVQYKSYAERNNNVSEKIVAIYDKKYQKENKQRIKAYKRAYWLRTHFLDCYKKGKLIKNAYWFNLAKEEQERLIAELTVLTS